MSRKLILTITLVIVVAMTAGSACADLIAYYPFEEGQGTETADATGNGNNGTLSAGVEWVAGQTKVVEKSVSFDEIMQA